MLSIYSDEAALTLRCDCWCDCWCNLTKVAPRKALRSLCHRMTRFALPTALPTASLIALASWLARAVSLVSVASIASIASVASIVSLALLAPVAKGDWLDDIGFTELESDLGGSVPTGFGVEVAIIEADADTTIGGFAYGPDTANPEFTGKTITDVSGIGTGFSGHATTVGGLFFGNTRSIAPGVTDIESYEAVDYLTDVLEFGSGGIPDVQSTRVQSNAWVGSTGDPVVDANMLARLDFAIDRDDFSSVVGMNNGGGGTVPLLGFGFNSIAVGLTSGSHVSGPTTTPGYGPGRDKPDIVAPALGPGADRTSWATGQSASAIAMLHEVGAGTDTDSVRSEPMKAIVMAGATKTEFGGAWAHSSTDPLDATYGAGELNVWNSYAILTAGQQEGTTGLEPLSPSSITGWDYEMSLSPASPRHYNLEIPDGQTATEFSASLNWNVEITDLNGQDAPSFTFANMDLRLYDSSTAFKGSLLSESISTDHNLEHLYLTNLDAGVYTLEVITDSDQDFGLAWRMHTIPEPSTACLLGIFLGALALRRRRDRS